MSYGVLRRNIWYQIDDLTLKIFDRYKIFLFSHEIKFCALGLIFEKFLLLLRSTIDLLRVR